jgi:hypothetical protein
MRELSFNSSFYVYLEDGLGQMTGGHSALFEAVVVMGHDDYCSPPRDVYHCPGEALYVEKMRRNHVATCINLSFSVILLHINIVHRLRLMVMEVIIL